MYQAVERQFEAEVESSHKDFNLKLFKNYIELDNQKKKLKQELDKVQEKMTSVEQGLIDMLIENDMSKIAVSDRLAFIHTTTLATTTDKLMAIKALKDAGYGDLVSEGFNSQQLSKLIRDLEEEESDSPETFKGYPKEFNGIIGKYSKQSLRVRKA